MKADILWQRLTEAGLVSGELPPAAVATVEAQSPWPVRLMLGIAGWIGALFLLGFALAGFALLTRSFTAALAIGVVCCFCAYAIFRMAPRNDFIAQFAFAVSLAGQALIIVGLEQLNGSSDWTLTFFLMAVIEAVLAVAIPNYLHRVFTTLAANACLLVSFNIMMGPLIPAMLATGFVVLVWFRKVPAGERLSFWEPIGYGSAIALLQIEGSIFLGADLWQSLRVGHDPVPQALAWGAQLITSALFLIVAWELGRRLGIKPTSPAGLVSAGAILVVVLSGLAAPGIAAALLVLVLGFVNANRVLMGLGLIGFGFYLSHFYYQLSTTLLTKSMVLTATGAALLALWWIVERYVPPPVAEEEPHAHA